MRCNLTCPHGDRCVNEHGHENKTFHDIVLAKGGIAVGCCHRVCFCNEPNARMAYTSDDEDNLPRSDGRTRYRYQPHGADRGTGYTVTVESVEMSPSFGTGDINNVSRTYTVKVLSDGRLYKAKIDELYPLQLLAPSDLKDTQPIRRPIANHKLFDDVARIDREAFQKAAEELADPVKHGKPSLSLQEANAYPNHCWRCSRHVRTGMVGVEDHAEGCPGRSIVFVHPKHAASLGATVHGSGWGDGWVRLTPNQPTANDDVLIKQRTDACEAMLRTVTKEYDPETPDRMARALRDLTDGYDVDVEKLLKTFPVDGDHGMVVVRDIPFASLCEHHVLPFSGTASVVYVPHNQVIGLSKIPRLVRAYSRRLQIQERIGMQVADAVMRYGHAKGVMVVIRGRHSCMALRGAESPGEMVTSCVRGCLEHEPAARAEALDLLR